MSSSSPSHRLNCPHCPQLSRRFTPHGLKIHIGHKHKNVSQQRSQLTSAVANPSTSQSDRATTQTQGSQHVGNALENLAALKTSVRVLRHIPKGARSLAAEHLCNVISKCIETNETADWCALLTFAYSALKTPDAQGPGNLTTKVKSNIVAAESMTNYLGTLDISMSVLEPTSPVPSLVKTIESKVFEGDLRGAVRLLMSNDSVAPPGPETLESLQTKHPPPSRPLTFPQEPDRSTQPLTVKVEEVCQALGTFYNGSAAGLDGIRPAHLKELTSSSAGDNGQRLLECLVKLCNFLLTGQLNPVVCPFMYGASLYALKKKEGGIRPIAVGSTFRRLVAKLGCRAVRERMAEYLQPHQLGFGTQRGCEAAIHATRMFAAQPGNADCVIIKLDVKNAFNTVERDVLLGEVEENIPSLYPFLHQVYHSPSNLFYNNSLILSQVGAQQGDPLGPLTFSLAIHKAMSSLKSSLNIWYLDDGTIGGKPEIVKQDLAVLLPRLKEMGLEVNATKCEMFCCGPNTSSPLVSSFSSLLPGLKELSRSTFYLLGSPIFPEAIPDAIETRTQLLLLARERLENIGAHVALVLLRMCFAVPKITYLLRTTPTWLCPNEVSSFDNALRDSAELILNVSLSDDQWSQASLPIRHGGLGLRRAGDVGLPAFLASAHGVSGLVSKILNPQGDKVTIPFVDDALAKWTSLFPSASMPEAPHVQRAWDDIGARDALACLIDSATGADLARLKSVSRAEAGAWLQALPAPYLGTLLDNDSMRVAVALRLGCDVCIPHKCICGSMVGANAYHALSCCRCSGRFPRHHALNDIVRRALISANIPCVLEPPGLCRTDGKRPDGLTLVPWQRGKCLLWDATCVSTFAASHLSRTVQTAGAAAEFAAARKRDKYSALQNNYYFVPLAFETTGCWGSEALVFIKEVGRRIKERGSDVRAGSYLVQRLSIAIQRGNAASVMGTFAPGTTRGGLFD
jgi:hypothetical protein